MNKSNALDVNWLKENHKSILYSGFGFIQIKISDRHRLHFYTRKLPPLIHDEDIHNHRYGFRSTLVKGRVSQRIYQIVPGTDGIIDQQNGSESVQHDSQPVLCSAKIMSTSFYSPGSSYFIEHDIFHRVSLESETAITMIKRTEPKKDFFDVFRHRGSPKIDPLSKQIDDQTLWKTVAEIIDRGHHN